MKRVVYFIAIFGIILAPAVTLAEHKSEVAGKIINSDDLGITPAHGEVCESVHYHGMLDGVADPAPRGCGHGVVTSIPHGDGDGESLPTLNLGPRKSLWTRFWDKIGSIFGDDVKNAAKDVVDVAADANGIPAPGTIHDTVEIVEEATPSIVEKVENIEEYRESVDSEEDTLDVYKKPEEGLEEGSLSQRFFRWFNSLLD